MKDRLTITVHLPNGKEPIIISLKTRQIKMFLAFLLVFLCFSFLSFLATSLLFKKYLTFRDKEKKLELMKEQTFRTKEEVKKIKDNLLRIEEYLMKRGIIKKEEGLGGISLRETPEVMDQEYLAFLNKHSERLLSQIRITPLGFPVKGEIVSMLGWRKNPFGKGYEYHTGVDIKANHGDPVKATADGVVEFTGWLSEYGNTVILKHPSGFKTLYGHLSKIKVKPQQIVKAGEVIGYVGSTGRSTGPHLHYEIQLNGKYLDPIVFIVWEIENAKKAK
jgi:murein DD-endopeptidase MepM/ murein hydrolase activator NlpD